MAYNSNISSGAPPILWSDVDSALRQINENFTLLGAALARTAPVNIAHIESGTIESNPVRIVSAGLHNFISEQQVTVVSSGVSQLDNNTYYVKVLSPTEIEIYQDTGLTIAVDGSSYDAYSSGGGTLQGISPFSSINFESLYTSVIPAETETYDLGSSSYRWKDIWLSGSSIYLGDAVISSTGTTVNLPVGSTIGGLRVDENYFKFISVAGQSTIEADDGTDTLTLSSSTGISITTNASTDTVTFENVGVTQLNPGSGISLSGPTGSVTVTNSGVRTLTGGLGVSANTATGDVTLTNDGVVGLDAGIGIGIGTRDPVTGRVTVTNSQPNIVQNAIVRFFVNGPTDPIIATSSTTTVNINQSGSGLSIISDGLDTVTLTNTGVTSFSVGDGLTVNAATGAISLSLDQRLNRDISGSIFAEDSTMLVDATDAKLVGPVVNSTVDTATLTVGNLVYNQASYGLNIDLAAPDTRFEVSARHGIDVANMIWGWNNSTGKFEFFTQGDIIVQPTSTIFGTVEGDVTGDLIGSVFADDSTKLVDAVEAKIVGDIENTNINTTIIRPTSGVVVIDANGGTANIISGVNGGIYVTDASVATAVQGNISLYSITSGQVDIGTQGTANGVYIGRTGITTTINGVLNARLTGDVNGSVFADDSTLLINGVDGTINATVLTGALPAIDGSALTGVIADSVAWADVTSTPTTLSGYGITDAATSAQGSLADSAIQPADLGTFTFTGSTLDTSDSSGISVTPAVTFNSDVTVENELIVTNSVTAGSFVGNLTATSVITSAITTSRVRETIVQKVDATGTVVHDLSESSVFYHTSIDANFTANFTNLDIASGQGTNISLILVQAGTGYIPNAVQIAGAAQTINWQDSTEPSGATNKIDIVTFSIINIGGTYTVFGALATFGA